MEILKPNKFHIYQVYVFVITVSIVYDNKTAFQLDCANI